MKTLVITTVSLLTLAAAMPAHASDYELCGNADPSNWMSVDALKAKATAMGYNVKKVEVDDGCFEIYALKDGKRVEVYFNPVTAEVVRIKNDD